jgi:hypothetical protein
MDKTPFESSSFCCNLDNSFICNCCDFYNRYHFRCKCRWYYFGFTSYFSCNYYYVPMEEKHGSIAYKSSKINVAVYLFIIFFVILLIFNYRNCTADILLTYKVYSFSGLFPLSSTLLRSKQTLKSQLF